MKSSGCLAIVLAASVARAEPVTKEQVEDAVNVLTHTLTTAEMSRAMNRPVDVRGLVPLIGMPFEYDGFTLADHCEKFSRSGRIEAAGQLAAFAVCASGSLEVELHTSTWSADVDIARMPTPLRSRATALARRDTLFVAELIHNQDDPKPQPTWAVIAVRRAKTAVVIDALFLSSDGSPPWRVNRETAKALDTWLAAAAKVDAALDADKGDCARMRRDVNTILTAPAFEAAKRTLHVSHLSAADGQRFEAAHDHLIEHTKVVCDGDDEARIGVGVEFRFNVE